MGKNLVSKNSINLKALLDSHPNSDSIRKVINESSMSIDNIMMESINETDASRFQNKGDIMQTLNKANGLAKLDYPLLPSASKFSIKANKLNKRYLMVFKKEK